MDILIEILLEIYMELMFLIVPEDRRRKKHRIIMAIIAIITTFGLMALIIWGGYLIWEKGNFWGVLPFGLAIVFSLAQITAGIILYNKKHKKD